MPVNHFSRWDPSSNGNNSSYRPPAQRSPVLNYGNNNNNNSTEIDSTTKSPLPASTAITTSEAPISLREKRKNNEYESPLARVRY